LLIVLRLEQGFDDSLYDSDDPLLHGYSSIHRLLVPALIAYDALRRDTEDDTHERMRQVALGNPEVRSATLVLERDNLSQAVNNLTWIALREALELPNDDVEQHWRIMRRDDPHTMYPGVVTWSATRTLARLDEQGQRTQAASFTRVRERYTLNSHSDLEQDDIRALLEENKTPDDVLLATATVYAVNKAIAKPQPHNVVENDYPHVAALINKKVKE